MKYAPEKHHRRSIRMKGFDYRQNAAYFVTLVSQGRECLFGEIMGGTMHLNVTGEIVQSAWLGLRSRFPGIELDEFVVMPNHFHAIIVAAQSGDGIDPRAGTSPAPTMSPGLRDVIGAFKSISTHKIILAVRRGDLPSFTGKIWQRNYYEHIIRDNQEWERIAQFIGANPTYWAEDAENPRR